MPRLFVAVELPDDAKRGLVALQTAIPTARWVQPEHMHLTLRFIGDVAQVASLIDRLREIQSAPFELQLREIGRFPSQSKRSPRVLWAGIKPQPALMAVQEAVELAVQSQGFPAEQRDYHPHITLARLKAEKPLWQVDAFLKQHTGFSVKPFAATRFVLVSSVLTPAGPQYSEEAVFNFEEG